MYNESDKNNSGSDNRRLSIAIAIIVIITIVVVAVAVYVVGKRASSVVNGEKNYDSIAQETVTENYEFVPVDKAQDITEEIEVEESIDPRGTWLTDADGCEAYKMVVDSDKLLETNDDYICWIYGCGGDINYPVCQSDDSQFYLNHGFDKSKNVYGALFTEMLNNGILYTDAVIYGHHMKNGTMFNKINEYKKEDYYKAHPYFYFFTNRGDAQYEIFSVYNIDMDVLEQIQYENEDLSREEYLESIKARSLYDTGVEISASDHIITLVTCEYSTDNGRMIVHCRKK